ncbi:MAG: alpha/beta hydrolase [Chlamydiales bacterium 38-26]|nr:alpha/beta hydrolase [Chlamydiales bacterium]OJV11357.1 MAG: alpha/beta hydrolase [Chlamydiales bacterium 38-26]
MKTSEDVALMSHPQTSYHTMPIDGIDIFYREAGEKDKPTIVLLHGFPSSSHMFRNLIPELAKDYHVIAPDYPGFGHSGNPDHKKFAYTFDKFAELMDKLLISLKIDKYAMYVFDYGAPVGFRLFMKHPEKITAIISQNGNAYDEGLGKFWDSIKAYWKTSSDKEREAIRWLTSIKATKWQYENGVSPNDRSKLSPDGWQYDQSLMDRPGNSDIQLDIFYDYQTNLPLYPKWQEAFRKYKPALLAVWGKNDEIFVAPGAEAYLRDLPDAEIHMLNTGHFAIETHGQEIASFITDFLKRKVKA